MPLTIEDGSIVQGADSYVSASDLKLYARARGVSFGNRSNQELEVLLIKAMDYLEGKRDKYKGRIASSIQFLQWPRQNVTDVKYKGDIFPANEIPRELIYAQMALAIEAMDIDLQPTQKPSDRGPVVSEEIPGVVKTAYAAPEGSKISNVPAFAKADALLAPLLKKSGLQLVRV